MMVMITMQPLADGRRPVVIDGGGNEEGSQLVTVRLRTGRTWGMCRTRENKQCLAGKAIFLYSRPYRANTVPRRSSEAWKTYRACIRHKQSSPRGSARSIGWGRLITGTRGGGAALITIRALALALNTAARRYPRLLSDLRDK